MPEMVETQPKEAIPLQFTPLNFDPPEDLDIENPVVIKTPQLPIRATLHEPGVACGKHFAKLLTEGAHINHIEVLMEEGATEEAVVLSLLKGMLDSSIWQTARYYFEESTLAAYNGSGATGEKNCGFCKGLFVPIRGGQKYCCNACGHRAAGLAPVVEHEDTCPILKKAA